MRYLFWFIRPCIGLVLGSLLTAGFSIVPVSASTMHTSSKSIQSTGPTACLQPPQNIDLATLSDADLASYGLPDHGTINADPAFWSVALAHSKTRTCESNQLAKRGRTALPQSKTSLGMHSPVNQSIWSDYEATGARGTYRGAELTFNVPTLASNNPANAVDSVWVGVGGDANVTSGSVVLPQIGVDSSDTGSDNCGQSQFNESWWEIAGTPDDPGATNLPLRRLCQQDLVYAYVSSNIQNDGFDYFYIANITDNNYNNHYSKYGSSYFSDSGTGECVQERLWNSNLGQWDPIAEPNPNAGGGGADTITYANCDIYDLNKNMRTVGNWPNFSYQIVDCNKNILVYPDPLQNNGANFLMVWNNQYPYGYGSPNC